MALRADDPRRQDLASDRSGDTDPDGVVDGFERWYCGNIAQGAGADSDGDGATLLDEFTAGSDLTTTTPTTTDRSTAPTPNRRIVSYP